MIGNKSPRRMAAVLFLFFLAQGALFAHPHMFFEICYELDTDGKNLNGYWVEWYFDVYFTQTVLYSADLNEDRQFDKDEMKIVYKDSFLNLAKYNFFQLIRQGKKRFEVDSVETFTAYLDQGQLVYRFYIETDTSRRKDIYLATYDPTFFCSIDFHGDDFIRFTDPDTIFQYTLEENPDFPVYYDPYGAVTESPIFTEWQPGLETYIPTEIHLWYD